MRDVCFFQASPCILLGTLHVSKSYILTEQAVGIQLQYVGKVYFLSKRAFCTFSKILFLSITLLISFFQFSFIIQPSRYIMSTHLISGIIIIIVNLFLQNGFSEIITIVK
jgi:hypothetical protein